jgi:hypothetical protein
MENRFYKENKIESINTENSFFLIDSNEWRKAGIISVERLGRILQIQLDEDIFKRNVTAVTFSKQDEIAELPPESLPVDPKTHISVDENYLYVWIPQSKRWKRIPLAIY